MVACARSDRRAALAQCYFYDSDIGGFHYGPGHPCVARRANEPRE
jgi:hypothetical protein